MVDAKDAHLFGFVASPHVLCDVLHALYGLLHLWRHHGEGDNSIDRWGGLYWPGQFGQLWFLQNLVLRSLGRRRRRGHLRRRDGSGNFLSSVGEPSVYIALHVMVHCAVLHTVHGATSWGRSPSSCSPVQRWTGHTPSDAPHAHAPWAASTSYAVFPLLVSCTTSASCHSWNPGRGGAALVNGPPH